MRLRLKRPPSLSKALSARAGAGKELDLFLFCDTKRHSPFFMHPTAETAHSAPSSKAASLEGLPMDSNPAVGPSQWDEEREG